MNGAGCVDELTEFDKIAGSDFGRAQRARRARAREGPSQSLPAVGADYGEVAERSKAHAWKVCNT